MEASPPTDDRYRFWLGISALTLALTALVAARFEVNFYRGLCSVEIAAAPPTRLDDLLIYLVVWSKSLLVALPLLAVCGTLRIFAWRKTARWLFVFGLIAITFWLVIDLMIQKATGNHALDYWRAVLNAKSWEWVGPDNIAKIQRQLTTWLILTSLTVLVAMMLTRALGRRLADLVGPHVTRSASIAAAALYAGLLLIALPAQSLASHGGDLVLAGLRLYMPVSALSLDRGESRATSRLNQLVAEHYAAARPTLFTAQPVDDKTVTPADRRPHVIVVVLESLRYNIIAPETMPRLHNWAQRGQRLDRHYAGSNCSQFGLFALLYGRSPLVYDACLDGKIPPQLCHSFRRSGYDSWFITSGDCDRFFRMGEYLNEQTFDHAVDYDDGTWPERDKQCFGRVREVLGNQPEQPKFIVTFLMSTHHDYQFPPEYARFKPYAENLDLLDADLKTSRTKILNRYQNAAAFLDDQVMDLIDSLDPEKHLIVVTGDHGESIFEDGALTHGSKLSEIQTRVPMVIGGAGVKPGVVAGPTTHIDLLPTLWHVLHGSEQTIPHGHGRSALASDRTEPLLLVQGFLDESTSRDWDRVLFIDGPWRLIYAMQRSAPVVRFQGFIDEAARMRFEAAPTDADIDRLSAELGKKLRTLAEQP